MTLPQPVLFVVALLLLWLPSRARALEHPVSVTVTRVYATREDLTVKIEVFLEDVFLFHNLQPNDQDFLGEATIREGIEQHKKFVNERFEVRDVAGKSLAGHVVGVLEFEMPPEGVPLAELMAHQLTFELHYDLPPGTEFLIFSQRFTDDEGMLPSEMKLILKQENAEETQNFELRPGDVEIVRLDWDLPPLSEEASAEERERWMALEKEEALGITNYSSVYSFLYIEDYEVRHEILIPLLTLEQSVLIARDDDDFLDLSEQDAARKQIEAYFRSGNPVTIDGEEARSTVLRCDFHGLDLKDFAMQAERKQVPIATARVGIILSYPADHPPNRVVLTWNRFSRFVWAVNTVVFAYDDTEKATLTRLGCNNVFEWENPGRPLAATVQRVPAVFPPMPKWSLPLVSLIGITWGAIGALVLRLRGARKRSQTLWMVLFAGIAIATWPQFRYVVPDPLADAPTVPEVEAISIAEKLHGNMYQAFRFREESAIYDTLALCVDGPLLREMYLQIRRGLEMQEQGGAVSRIQKVEIVEGQYAPLAEGANASHRFAYHCRWNVSGTVEHWGHIHQRTNQYEALFQIQAVDTAWKVTNMDLVDEKRIQFETKLRGL